MISAPDSTMPWMELAADISGVCSVVGTLLMTSKPTSRLSTKMLRSVRNSALIARSPFSFAARKTSFPGLPLRLLGGLCRSSCPTSGRGADDLARVGDDDAGLDRIVEIDDQPPVAHQMPEHGDDVAGVGRRGGARHRGRQIVRADHRYAAFGDDRLA